jgi:hypothetical protein
MSETQSDPQTETIAGVPAPRGPWTPSARAAHAPSAGVRWPTGPGPSSPPAGFRPAPPAGPVPPTRFPVEPPAGLGWGVPATPAVPPSRPRWGWIVVGVLAFLAVIGLLATVVSAHRTMTVQGSVTAAGYGTLTPGEGCSMTSMQGRPVSIFGADGTLVGTTSLPTYGIAVREWNTYSSYADGCRFDITFTDVAARDDYYRVGVGTDPTNAVGFSRDQLESSGANITYGHS